MSVPNPSPRAIEAALYGLRKSAPFTDAHLDEHFALLCLPILDREIDDARRPALFREALRQGITDLEPRFQILARHLLLPETNALITSRREAAIAEMREIDPDWVEELKPTTLERRALSALSDLLTSDEFARNRGNSLDFTSAPTLAEDLLGYRWVRAKQELRISADNPSTFIWAHQFEIEATRDHLRVFAYDYHWSGNQHEPPTPRLMGDDSRQTHLGICAEEQFGQEWMVHFVHLGRHLARGQTITVAFETQLRDDDGSSEPYNALLPRFDGVEELEFICRLPDARGERMRCSTWDVSELTPVERPIGPLSARADGSYYHSVKSPTRGTAYGIAWG